MQKVKKVRIKGTMLSLLNDRIHQRDNDCCIYCGKFVNYGEKFHHVTYKSHGGEDVEDNGVLLCMDCHTECHHGKESERVKEFCRMYLNKMYGGI